MAEQEERHSRELLLALLHHFMGGEDQRIPAVLVAEISQRLVFGGFAVSGLVIGHDSDSLLCQKLCEFIVALAVLRHAVNHHHACNWLSLRTENTDAQCIAHILTPR